MIEDEFHISTCIMDLQAVFINPDSYGISMDNLFPTPSLLEVGLRNNFTFEIWNNTYWFGACVKYEIIP